MTQQNCELLLKDVSARLPYGVKLTDGKGNIYHTNPLTCIGVFCNDGTWVPYLRPMSSMTEEERKEYQGFFEKLPRDFITPSRALHLFDWLNAHHFDFRNLIGQGLALEAPEGIYNK